MSSKSLMLLRTAIRDPQRFQGHSTGHPDLDQLWQSWSEEERNILQHHESTNALPKAMNDAFLSESYSPASVRIHPTLSRFIKNLDDNQLNEVQALMAAKKGCDEDIQPSDL